jgi:preprotein translocase subunit SecY
MATQTRAQGRPQLLQAGVQAFAQPDIRDKLLFTFAMIIIFRFVSNVPVPGINTAALDNIFESSTVLGFLNIFSGGALANMSIVAMGVYPYITASIVMQLMIPIVPTLQALSREGEQGRKQLNIYQHWMTVPMAMVQGYGQLILIQSQGGITGIELTGPNALPTISAIITMTAGTMFLVWIGELISERGLGNGISIIIFAGIVSGLPQLVVGNLVEGTEGIITSVLLGLCIFGLVAYIVFFQEAQRRIPVQYSRSVFRSGRMYRQSGQTHIPLKVNTVGMIPLIFANSIIIFPAYMGSILATSGTEWLASLGDWMQTIFDPANALYWVLLFLTVVVFTFFYTVVVFQQQNMAENLQRQGGFIPGIRPGRPTQEYINRVLIRITWGGAFFLGTVSVAPYVLTKIIGANTLSGSGQVLAFSVTASGLIIVVGVILDTLRQIEAQLLMRQYEGFIR